MKNIKIIGISIIVLIFFGLIFFFNKNNLLSFEKDNLITDEEIKQDVVLIIDYEENNSIFLETEFKEGMTAFSLLEGKAEEMGLVLEVETYDIGVFINTIGDKKNGQDGKYWLYYVNDEASMVASDKNKINPGDKVEFRFEESIF